MSADVPFPNTSGQFQTEFESLKHSAVIVELTSQM